MSVTDVKNTRLQGKLGPYVETFLTSMLLAEVKGRMPDAESEKMAAASLDRVVAKISKHQKADGTWTDAGWAPVLAQSLASKGLNRAAQNGVQVSDRVLARTEKNARDNFRAAELPAGSVVGPVASRSEPVCARLAMRTCRCTASPRTPRPDRTPSIHRSSPRPI
jgi:hypothetical protein